MILTTTESIHGESILKTLGIVTGISVQAKPIGADLKAGFKTIRGGEIDEYTDMVVQAKQKANEKMIAAAVEMGAHAIIGIQYTTSSIMEGAAEILVYGTAVTLASGGQSE